MREEEGGREICAHYYKAANRLCEVFNSKLKLTKLYICFIRGRGNIAGGMAKHLMQNNQNALIICYFKLHWDFVFCKIVRSLLKNTLGSVAAFF